jgi:hypothetical protein
LQSPTSRRCSGGLRDLQPEIGILLSQGSQKGLSVP